MLVWVWVWRVRDGVVRDVEGRERSELPNHGRQLLQLVVREVQFLEERQRLEDRGVERGHLVVGQREDGERLERRQLRRDAVERQRPGWGVSSESFRSRRSFISSPLWTPSVYGPTS